MIVRILTVLLLASPTSAIELGTPVSLCSIANELKADLHRLSRYRLSGACPTIRFSLRLQEEARQIQVGSFDLETFEIGLAADLDMTTVFGRSILLHEMVHLAQVQSGRRYSCPEAMEYEAYSVQAAYLREHGLVREAGFAAISASMRGRCPDEEY